MSVLAAPPTSRSGIAIADDFPGAFAWGRDGSVILTLDNGREVSMVDTSGQFRWRVRRVGQGPGEYGLVGSVVTLPDDQVGVIDILRRRFHVWSANGDWLRDTLLDMPGVRPRGSLTSVVGALTSGQLLAIWSEDAVGRSRDSLGLDTTFVEIFEPARSARRVGIARVQAVASVDGESLYESIYETAIAACDSGILQIDGDTARLRDHLWREKKRWLLSVPQVPVQQAAWTENSLKRHIPNDGDRERVARFFAQHRPSEPRQKQTPKIDASGRLWYHGVGKDPLRPESMWQLMELTASGRWELHATAGPNELPVSVLQFGGRYLLHWSMETDSTDGALQLIALPDRLIASSVGLFGHCQAARLP